MDFTRIRRLTMELPVVRRFRRLRYENKVRTATDWTFWGIFPSYKAAVLGTPDNPALGAGYDVPGMADRGRDDYERMEGFDYPALFWLTQFADSGTPNASRGCTVVDLGGHLGVKYRAYLRNWTPPDGLSWVVCETPETVKASESLTEDERPVGLSFTTDASVIDGSQILFASGVLAYMEKEIWDILDECERPPNHLILNKVPLSNGPETWTLQNASSLAIVPYHVFNRARFLKQLLDRGYRLLDEWAIPERTVRIPFQDGFGTEIGSGLSFALDPIR